MCVDSWKYLLLSLSLNLHFSTFLNIYDGRKKLFVVIFNIDKNCRTPIHLFHVTAFLIYLHNYLFCTQSRQKRFVYQFFKILNLIGTEEIVLHASKFYQTLSVCLWKLISVWVKIKIWENFCHLGRSHLLQFTNCNFKF